MSPRVLKGFVKNERGNFALTFAVGATVTIGIIGASIDYGMASNASSRAQSIADSIALNAAIYIRNNTVKPNATDPNETGITEGRHTAAALGIDFSKFASGGSEGVFVDVDYGDDVNNWATVKVSGQVNTTFMRLLGRDSVPFESVAEVAYSEVQLNDVASIAFVLDNSGSMAWDDIQATTSVTGNYIPDSSGSSRLASLKSSMSGFMSYLSTLVGDQTNDADKLVRTGMLAYNSGTISSRTINMGWNLISDSNINAMSSGGGTNSSPPMGTIATNTWMLGEDAVHQAINGKDPLKFVIFMTDGVNNNSGTYWTNEDETDEYRRLVEYWNGWGWSSYYEYSSDPDSLPDSWTKRVCGWYSCWNRTYYGRTWNEGRWVMPDDENTLAACTTLKNNGVKIYTIGFALEPGYYGTNATNSWGNEGLTHIDEDTTNQAYAFLSNCASSPDTFITATDGAELNAAFARIGKDIVEEVIRVKS